MRGIAGTMWTTPPFKWAVDYADLRVLLLRKGSVPSTDPEVQNLFRHMEDYEKLKSCDAVRQPRHLKVSGLAQSIRDSGLMTKKSWRKTDEDTIVNIMKGIVCVDMSSGTDADRALYAQWKVRYQSFANTRPYLMSRVRYVSLPIVLRAMSFDALWLCSWTQFIWLCMTPQTKMTYPRHPKADP